MTGALWRGWTALVRRLAHREPATALALFRIAVALCVVYALGQTILSDTVTAVWVAREHGGMKSLVTQHWLVAALGGATPAAVWGLIATALAGALCLALGLGARVAALVTGQCCIALFSLHPTSGGGHDRVITNALWLLVLAPSSATLSLDCWLRHRRFTSAAPVAAWPRYLAVVQISVIYGMTGVQKLGSSWFPWGDYSAVYYALQTPSWARHELDQVAVLVAHLYPLTQLGTAVTWLWELSFPVVLLALYWRATRDRPGRLRAWANRVDLRRAYALVGLLMHGLLFVMMELGPFSLITPAFYLCLWHPDEWARIGRRLSGGRLRSAPSPGR